MQDATTNSPPLRVFVVENHAVTARYLQLHLENEGYDIPRAATVAEALEQISPASCDVLTSDVGLPDGDGWSLLQRLTDQGSNPPFSVAISGNGTASDRTRSAEAGFRHHLVKPFDPDELDTIFHQAPQERAARN